MLRNAPLLILICLVTGLFAQREERLPADLRQHNLTTYNASLFNPAFSLDRNNAQSIAFWSRWQWQSIDADPTTIFLNYTRRLNSNSAAGVAFLQQNTGVYFNTGGALNYAHQFQLNELVQLSVGINVFAFQQELADDRFVPDPNFPLPQESIGNDFIVQMAPGMSLSVERLTLGLASENLIDYNFNEKEGNTAKEDKIFMGILSYDFPLVLGNAPNAFLRPSMYLRTIPGQSNQVGFYTLMNTDNYWGQVGYNNFYGYGIGAGVTLFKHLSLGALVELGTKSNITNQASFELMAAYFLGKPSERHKMVGFEPEEDENGILTLEEEQNERIQKELDKAEELAKSERAEEKASRKEVRAQEKEQKRRDKIIRDSIANVEKEAAVAAMELKKKQEEEEKARQRELIGLTDPQLEIAEEQPVEKLSRKERKAAEALAIAQEEQERKLDSINEVKRQEALAQAKQIAEQKRLDSIAKVEEEKQKAALAKARQQEKVVPEKGEKYEEVKIEEGLAPGYYLIANVFGTKKYFDAFMADLRKKGMNPGSFVRSTNKYNYAYLERFDTISEARQARNSNYGGKYPGKTWIFRVVGE
ncbi:PorP/SprF family type IX secretion system membrane protein [Cytophaga sp. FL35]|uniref:PorP/SprF family type IX secretion system membrane protein n=1 Tax=Cytophaga sp. FL35 TaxID=1904456 RepID=UPI001653DE5E|nr:PorP/SprF family type IX secretion system membrane protein [Cytophaga sp. FL35]MBC6998732.1 PorP/SprF family type IX secretion system membrane protein [Cytophaga sp. FL35]